MAHFMAEAPQEAGLLTFVQAKLWAVLVGASAVGYASKVLRYSLDWVQWVHHTIAAPVQQVYGLYFVICVARTAHSWHSKRLRHGTHYYLSRRMVGSATAS